MRATKNQEGQCPFPPLVPPLLDDDDDYDCLSIVMILLLSIVLQLVKIAHSLIGSSKSSWVVEKMTFRPGLQGRFSPPLSF